MRTLYGFDNLPQIIKPCVAVGSFDGVHKGHRLLISQLHALARERGGESVVITFNPHPRQLLRGENRLLSTIEEKLMLLSETEVDNVIVVNFTKEFSQISHSDFMEHYIIGKLHTRMMVTGQQHNFGHNRGGDIDYIKKSGIEICKLDRFDEISSTQIRAAIETGQMRKASELLGGGGYLICSPVTDSSKLIPPDGEYQIVANTKLQNAILSRHKMLTEKQNIRIICEL